MDFINLQRLIDYLEHPSPDVRFNIAELYKHYGHPICRTQACLAGFAVHLAFNGDSVLINHMGVAADGFKRPFLLGVARMWLGLTEAQADALFQPPNYIDDQDCSEAELTYTRERAVATLKRLRDTGVVEWSTDQHEEND